MDGIIFGLFAFSIVLIFGAIYHVLSLKKPGFYPPKPLLKKRAALLAISGVVCLLMALLFLGIV